jgi:hypothetical protein
MKDLERIRTALQQAIEFAEQKGDRPAALDHFLTGKVLKWRTVKDPVLRIVALQYQHVTRMLNELIIYWGDVIETDLLGAVAVEVDVDPLEYLKPTPWSERGLSWLRLGVAVEAYVNDPQPETAARLLLANEDHSAKSLALQRYICERQFTRCPTLVSRLYFDDNAGQ